MLDHRYKGEFQTGITFSKVELTRQQLENNLTRQSPTTRLEAFNADGLEGDKNINDEDAFQEMCSKTQTISGFGRRIFEKKEINKKKTEDINDKEKEKEETDVLKDLPDYERSQEKRLEIQNFLNDYNKLVIDEKSGSRSKLKTGKYLGSTDFLFCQTHTKFSESEILRWFKGFRTECPNGHLAKSHLSMLFNKVFPEGNSSVFTNHIFRIFDKDNNGFLDFKEFLMAIDVTSCKTTEDKMKWAFRLYDIDNNGEIDVDEMTEIIEILDDLSGHREGDRIFTETEDSEVLTSAKQRATEMFEKLDIDKSGGISLDEFVNFGKNLFEYQEDYEDDEEN